MISFVFVFINDCKNNEDKKLYVFYLYHLVFSKSIQCTYDMVVHYVCLLCKLFSKSRTYMHKYFHYITSLFPSFIFCLTSTSIPTSNQVPYTYS